MQHTGDVNIGRQDLFCTFIISSFLLGTNTEMYIHIDIHSWKIELQHREDVVDIGMGKMCSKVLTTFDTTHVLKSVHRRTFTYDYFFSAMHLYYITHYLEFYSQSL